MQAKSLSSLDWIGLRWLGMAVILAVGCAYANATAVIDGTHFMDSRSVTCGQAACFVTAGAVPAGKQLLVTRVNCSLVLSGNVAGTPQISCAQLGAKSSSAGSRPEPPHALFAPTLAGNNGGTRIYGFNSDTSVMFTAAKTPQLYFSLFPGTWKINNIECTLFGDLTSTVP